MNTIDQSIEARVRAEAERKMVVLVPMYADSHACINDCSGPQIEIPSDPSRVNWPLVEHMLTIFTEPPAPEPTIEEQRLETINTELARLGYEPISKDHDTRRFCAPTGRLYVIGAGASTDPHIFAGAIAFLRSLPTPEPKEEPKPEPLRPRKTKILDWTAPVANPDPETLYLRLVPKGRFLHLAAVNPSTGHWIENGFIQAMWPGGICTCPGTCDEIREVFETDKNGAVIVK